MRQLRAMLGDSYREAVDRKTFVVLILLALLPVLFCSSISLEREPIEETIRARAMELGRFRHRHSMGMRSVGHGVDPSVGDIRQVDSKGIWPDEVAGGHVVELGIARQDLERLAVSWKAFRERIPGEGTRPASTQPGSRTATEEEVERFLIERFQASGFQHVAVRRGEGSRSWHIALATDYPHEIEGAHRVEMFFGLLSVPLEQMSIAEFLVTLQLGLADAFAGFLAMLIALLVTASFVPNMLQKGTLDLLLARPIGRVRLLLYKYFGGVWFIFLFGVVLVGGSWFAIGARTGFYNPWFLASIVTLMATFAVLYSISVLVGVFTRSSGLSALVALGVWGLSSTVVGLRHNLKLILGGETEIPPWVDRLIEIAYAVLPKTKDIATLNTLALSRSHLSEEAFERTFGAMIPDVDWLYSLGTTGAFVAVVLGLAAVRFRLRDY